MRIPSYLNGSKVLEALGKIEKEGFPPKRAAKKYCLVHCGKHYSPKVVVSYSHLLQVGEELPPGIFFGGIKQANKWLGKWGYNVIECPYKCGGHGRVPAGSQ